MLIFLKKKKYMLIYTHVELQSPVELILTSRK
jgi:hypothetical protein